MGKYTELFELVEQHPEYWAESAIIEFTEDLARIMAEQEISRTELADLLGTSKAYVTKVLRGDANFTLATMVKLASALDSKVHIHIAPKGVSVRWVHDREGVIFSLALAAESEDIVHRGSDSRAAPESRSTAPYQRVDIAWR